MSKDWAREFYNQDYMGWQKDWLSPASANRDVQRIVHLCDLKPGESILDLACGEGRHSLELARQGFGPIVGLDFTPSYIAEAKRQSEEAKLEIDWHVKDMRQLDYPQKFDLVFNCFDSLFYWDDATHEQIFGGIYRALKPGGKFYFEATNRERIAFDEQIRQHPRLSKLRKIKETTTSVYRQIFPKKTAPTNVIRPRRNHTFDLETGYYDEVWVYQASDGSEQRYETRDRLYSLSEVKLLLDKVGFHYVRSFSAPDGGTFRWNSRRLGVVAQRI